MTSLALEGGTSFNTAVVGNTYTISSQTELMYLANYTYLKETTGLNFTQTADIDLAQSDGGWTGGTCWTPIGSDSLYKFNGTFDGNGKTISNLYINALASSYGGLFGYTDTGSTIKNLGLENVSVVNGKFRDGGLAGFNSGTITNCYATGNLSGTNTLGGLVGQNGETGSVRNCSSTVNITAADYTVGGLVGYNRGEVQYCYAAGTVSGNNNVGGLVGYNEDSNAKITNSTALNPYINSLDTIKIGRVAGLNSEDATITNCYAWEGTLVNGDIVTDGTKDNINGEDVSVSQIWAFVNSIPTFWSALGFTGTNWEVNTTNDKYKLPVLKNSGTSGLDASYLIFRGGNGGANTPYQIKYAYDLKTLANLTNNVIEDKVNNPGTKYSELNYTLMNDIDLSSVCGADIGSSGISWTPIGTDSSHVFKGKFDGDGKTISNLYINTPNVNQGLFGYTESATIKNVILKNVNVTCTGGRYGDYGVGGIVGAMNDGTITNCHAKTGEVNGIRQAGGLVGFISQGTIDDCSAGVTVKTYGWNNAGGLIGQLHNSGTINITNCHATGDVECVDPEGGGWYCGRRANRSY